MSESPGISLEAVFAKAPESALRRFIGESTIEVLSALNPELVTRKSLIRLAIGALPAIQVIRDKQARDEVIDMLPLEKAAEAHADLEGRKTTGKLVLNP